MQESTTQYWKRILETMAARNRNRLGETAYLKLLTVLENESDSSALRKLAIDSATALGRLDRRSLLPHPGDASLNRTYRENSIQPKLSMPENAADASTRDSSSRPSMRARHRPTMPRPS
jgi:hypothetical protein